MADPPLEVPVLSPVPKAPICIATALRAEIVLENVPVEDTLNLNI